MSKIMIHNVETGEIIDREMSFEELAQRQADLAAAETEALQTAKKAATKKVLLEKLGITEAEAEILLG